MGYHVTLGHVLSGTWPYMYIYIYVYITPACDERCFAHMFGRNGCQWIIMKGFLSWRRNSGPDKTVIIRSVFFIVLFGPFGGVLDVSRYFGFSKVVDLAESFKIS